MQSNECQVKGVNHFPQSTVRASVCAAEDTIGHICCQDTLLPCAQLAVGPSWALFAKLLPRCPVSSLYCCQGLFLPRGRTGHLSLLNFMRFLLAHSSSLPGSLWMAALPASMSSTPLSLGLSVDFVRVCSVFSSILLTETLNKTRWSPEVFYSLLPSRWSTTMSRYPLSSTVQSVFHPASSPSTQTITSQLGYKDVARGRWCWIPC